MKTIFKKILLLFFGLQCIAGAGYSQVVHEKLKGWHLLNYQQDGYMGTGVKEAYELLKGRKSTTVVIAVIDSGVDG
jgi:cell wall-associated protease